MRKLLPALSVLTCLSAAANAPVREVTSQAFVSAGSLIPAYYQGYIYWAGKEPLRVFAPDGLPAYTEGPKGTAQAVAADTDGRIAVAWTTLTGGGIDFHDHSGALTKTVQTGSYRPTHLAFAEDHSLWSVGWQTDTTNVRPDRTDYAIVRKFLPEGEQAGAYLPRSLFPIGLEPGETGWQRSNSITVSHDRIGLWVNSGMNSTRTEWVELDLSGKLTGRWRLDAFVNDARLAFTSDNHVFVYFRDPNGKNPRLVTLDRDTSTWQPAPFSAEGALVSADGEAIIFATYNQGPIHLRWYQHP